MNHLKIPTITIAIFFILYFLATFYYTGTSEKYPEEIGFNWLENYWCDLLVVTTDQGIYNPAFPIAITAMIILCLGLAYFFYLFPKYFPSNSLWNSITRVCGILSMFFAMLIFTDLHDKVILVGSVLGLLALTGMFIGLFKSGHQFLLRYGIFCMLVVIYNNTTYFLGYRTGLPLVQKISFLIILFWVILLNNEYRAAHIDK